MNRLTFAAITAAALALNACGQSQATTGSNESTHPTTASDVERCSKGGMDAANDPACKAASDQRFRDFMNGGGSSEHRNR